MYRVRGLSDRLGHMAARRVAAERWFEVPTTAIVYSDYCLRLGNKFDRENRKSPFSVHRITICMYIYIFPETNCDLLLHAWM